MEWQQRFAVLCELELTIQRVKVMTTPDGSVLDLFFITDNMEILHTKKRQDETLEQLHAVLGESCISCELQLAGTEYEWPLGISFPSPEVAEELFRYELSDKEIRSQALSPDMSKLKKASVTVDNSLSPAHTLLQIHCADHKCLLYDIMRTLKDCNIQIAYGRFSPNSMGYHDLDLFIHQKDGKKILDPEKQNALCSRFQAEIGRYSTSESDHEWEVHRFLLDENCRFQLSKMIARNQIVDRVRRTLMGWLCELFTFLCLIDMYFCLAFSSSNRFSLGLKGVISFAVFIGNCLEYRQAQNADAASVISEHYHVECNTKHDPATTRMVITLQTLKSIRRRAKAKQVLAIM
ncbi:hypothetical protein SO802_018163 [Lithocarpus litseifolius]|uniref:ACT domain-containing protein ACR n=1 Tax=Lithocarpus litseifolius TaxID=425828 RepID=A0AAW2CNE7_9ROSI